MPSEPQYSSLSRRLSVMAICLCCLALAGCPASTPTTPQPPSSSPPSSSPPSSSPPSSSPPSEQSSDSSSSESGSSSSEQSANNDDQSSSTGESGSSGDVWQPPSAGGMPGQEQSADSQGSDDGGGLEGIDMEDIGVDDGGMTDSEMVDLEIESGDMAGAEGGGSDALPSLEDEELLDMSLEDFEESMRDAAAEAAASSQSQGQQSGQSGSDSEDGSMPGGGAQGDGSMASGGMPRGSGEFPGGGFPQGSGGGNGTMTTVEQVAILDAQLESSTDDFDDLILRERDVIRRTAKDRGVEENTSEDTAGGGYGGYGGYGETPPMRDSGGGQGGSGAIPRSGGRQGDFPAQTAMYPPPEDIPSGNDDDVVARQLREAAMRETDPQLREKLWDEYRKYKGIDE